VPPEHKVRGSSPFGRATSAKGREAGALRYTPPVNTRFSALVLFAAAVIGTSAQNGRLPVPPQARTESNPADGLTYVWIPAGAFQMGCSQDDSQCNDDEKPVHTVTITKGFWIGQTPVTQAAWGKFFANSPSHFPGPQQPVNNVTWDNAQAFCAAAGMRLPTEAEYEYAARAGTTGARYGPLAEISWYAENSGGSTREVGQKQPNAFGLYDALGNVWEWVADWYGPYDATAAVDPKGPANGRTARATRQLMES
jgi:formylglycine-generating enzyme required for sulfatase activity